MSAHLPILTTSQGKAFRRCPRYHFYTYELGYRPAIASDPLRFGTLFHRLLELRALRGLHAALDWIAAEEGLDPFDRAKAEELLVGYDVRWGDDWEIVAVEKEFRLPLRNPETGALSRTWIVGGKIDLVVRRAGALWLVEHKTSSEDIAPGSRYWQKLRLDAQISTYLEGARSLGFVVTGVLYDVIGKPALRPLKATPVEARKYTKDGRLYAAQRDADEDPDEYRERLRSAIVENPERYYVRGEVVRLETEEREAAFDLWQHARSIREAQTSKRWPRNPESCFLWERPCDFFPVCTGQAGLDSTLYRKAERTHEELTDDNATNNNSNDRANE